MTNAFISLTIAIMSFSMFTITYRLNGINRTLFNIPISIFESSIPLVTDDDEITLYFDKDELENRLTYYFEKTICKYTEEYELSFYYYNISDKSLCVDDYCTAIEITFTSEIVFGYNYRKSMDFYIRSNK